MANAIVVIAVIIIMLFAGKGAYKHLKGEGACCGGGSKPEIPKKKLDGTKLGEKTMKITGMHCENCVASVTRAINLPIPSLTTARTQRVSLDSDERST